MHGLDLSGDLAEATPNVPDDPLGLDQPAVDLGAPRLQADPHLFAQAVELLLHDDERGCGVVLLQFLDPE